VGYRHDFNKSRIYRQTLNNRQWLEAMQDHLYATARWSDAAQRSDHGEPNASDRAVRQGKHVVPNGAISIPSQARFIQSSQSRPSVSFGQCGFQNFFSSPALASSCEVLQMLGFRMHDVEMGRRQFAARLLRPGGNPNRYRVA
jgi:hypothetical protein